MIIAIDPGYATIGVVIGHPDKPVIAAAFSIKDGPCDHTPEVMMARCHTVVEKAVIGACTVIENLDARSRVTALITEDFVGQSYGASAMTAYYRGFVDAVLMSWASHLHATVHRLRPANVKAFLNPMGKATDHGMKTDLEYKAALNRLDSIFTPESLKLVAAPAVVGAGKWKDARLHTLDAAAMLAIYYCYRGLAKEPRAQRDVVAAVAQRWGAV